MDHASELTPHAGDHFHCEKCGLEIEVTKGCTCEKGCAEFRCCGQNMVAKSAEAAVEKTARNIYQA